MDNRKTVRIKGEEYKVKKTIRSLFIYEQISGKGAEVKSTLDNFLFLYSVLLACNPEKALGWDEFIDAIDEDDSLIDRMNRILKDGNAIESLLENGEPGEGGEKKN